MLVSFLFFSCSKIISQKDKKPENFSIFLPLAEDFPILKKSIHTLVKSKFPNAKIQMRDYLAPNYVMAPFDEWLMRANEDGLLQLFINVPDLEERDSLIAFLKQNSAKILFRHSLPPLSSQKESRVSRGEAYFCKIRSETKDILEQQLCHTLVSLLCSSSTGAGYRNPYKISHESSPLCSLRFYLPKKNNKSREIKFASFPLPIKFKNDYPFERFTEIDESAIMNLFRE
jgi:hypothetical protein